MKKIDVLDVLLGLRKVGRIAQTKNGLCAFEYDTEYLRNGISISPFDLPLKANVFIAKQEPFYGNFGVFDDCLPDGWGMLVLDRYLKKKGINPDTLTLLQRLSLVGTSGRGALEFIPDQSYVSNEEIKDFGLLATEAAILLKTNDYLGENIESLYLHGGSPGGAQPKVFAKFEGKEWLVKFKSTHDSEDIGRVEYDYSLLAKKCGIEMPETRLFENKYFGTARFDRIANEKLHVVSVAGLLNANYRIPCIDYLTIMQLCRSITRNEDEMWKVFRLMVFNFLIQNKDDHAKNFSFILRNEDWHLAPAYDILPSKGINGYRTTSINDSVSPTKNDLFAVAQKSGLAINKAKIIYDEIRRLINN